MKKQTKLDKHISCTFSLPFSLYTDIADAAFDIGMNTSAYVKRILEAELYPDKSDIPPIIKKHKFE